MKQVIQFRVRANLKVPSKISTKSTDNEIYFLGVLVCLILTVILAAWYLVKTISDGFDYPTWNLLFDYPAGEFKEPSCSTQYMEVSVNADDVLNVMQKTSGVLSLVHADDELIVLKIRRNGCSYAGTPRGLMLLGLLPLHAKCLRIVGSILKR